MVMDWNSLSMSEKSRLMRIYLENGISSLDDMKEHYNHFSEGVPISVNTWKTMMKAKYPDIEFDNNKAGYDYDEYFKNNYLEAIKQLQNLQHFPDTYKLPNHKTFSDESIYSRGPNTGGSWSENDEFTPSVINKQIYPEIYREERPYTEREIYGHQYGPGGFFGKVYDYAKELSNKPKQESYKSKIINKNIALTWQDVINKVEGGRHSYVYDDGKGNPTAGVGHKLTTNERKLYPMHSRVPDSVIDDWTKNDYGKDISLIDSIYSDYVDIIKYGHPNQYAALVSMAHSNPTFVTKKGSPKFYNNYISYLNNPSKEKMDLVLKEMQRIDDGSDNVRGLMDRYGLERWLFNSDYDTSMFDINNTNWENNYDNHRFKLYKSNKKK